MATLMNILAHIKMGELFMIEYHIYINMHTRNLFAGN